MAHPKNLTACFIVIEWARGGRRLGEARDLGVSEVLGLGVGRFHALGDVAVAVIDFVDLFEAFEC